MRYSLILSESHLTEIKKLILKDDGFERPAILLCGRSFIQSDAWDREAEYKFLSKEIIAIPDNEINSHDEISLNWNTDILRKVLKRAHQEDLSICLVHSHPSGAEMFSEIDDEEEQELFSIIYNRYRNETPHLSLVITFDNKLIARACDKSLNFHSIDFIKVLGDKFSFHYPNKYANNTREEFNRQQIAFGSALNNDLAQLKIGIVGCGATGSATAHLLARLGVGHLLLIDNDTVERSNLSRLYGATTKDIGRSKVEVLQGFISSIGFSCQVETRNNWVGDGLCRDAIKSCDIIFGCTDDNSGRVFLNRFAHFYLTPVIDMGIVIDLSEDKAHIDAMQARVTVIMPGNTCLLCRNTINKQLAREDDLKRNDSDAYERQLKEAYVIGGGNPSPAVITFTTEAATMAVNELISRITGFKKTPQNHVIRFFDRGSDSRPGAKPVDTCPICNSQEYWGQGDVEPFMDQTN